MFQGSSSNNNQALMNQQNSYDAAGIGGFSGVGGSGGGLSPTSLLMKSIEKASPRELCKILRETAYQEHERKWNASDLRIEGQNMGFPDYLKNLTFAQH